MLLGAHMSIAGGVAKAIDRGRDVGCTALQIFTKNASQWRAKPLLEEDVAAFKKARRLARIGPVVAHNSYLVNLASPDKDLFRKSLAAMRDEIERAEALELQGVVMHPGAHVGSGEAAALRRLARALDQLLRSARGCQTMLILETTAGQGTCLGHRFEHLAAVLDMIAEPERVGICLDSCHVFTAGYDIRTPAAYRRTLAELDRVVGLERLKVIHLNDTPKELGSRRDRHSHIGQGVIGLEAFRCIMRDRRLAKVPKIIETPKGEDLAEDRMNLETLRKLARPPRRRARQRP